MPKYCVYAASLSDVAGRDYAPGDGITAPSRRLYAVVSTIAEAEAVRQRLNSGRILTRARMPGDGTLYPELEIGPFDPLQFIGRQNRDQYTGKRYAVLCAALAAQARKNAAGLQ